MSNCVFVALNVTLSGAYPEVRDMDGKALTTSTNAKMIQIKVALAHPTSRSLSDNY